MATISNYLNGNYLLNSTTSSTLILMESPSSQHNTYRRLTQYQISNHQQESKRPFLLIDFEDEFDGSYSLNQLREQKLNLYIYEKSKYKISQTKDFQIILNLLETITLQEQSLEILILGIELIDFLFPFKKIYGFIMNMINIHQRLQITIPLNRDLISNDLYVSLNSMSSCNIIIQQKINDEIFLQLLIKKQSGYCFMKNYTLDYQKLLEGKLKIDKVKKIVKQEEEDTVQSIQDKLKTSFNFSLSQEQKKQKAQLDNQINPYKNVMQMKQEAPLIYNKDEDLKRMTVDLDMDEDQEDDDDFDV